MISLKDLTKEQIEELQAQIKLKEAEEQEKRKQDRTKQERIVARSYGDSFYLPRKVKLL